jgi:hypothetical protein
MSMFNLINGKKEDKQVGVIFETTDYDKFSLSSINREIDYKHVERLKKDMRERFIRTNLIVDKQFTILDGQHRFEAMRSLNIPVTYTIVTPKNFEMEIITMNTNTKNWNNDDLLKLYVKKERKANPHDFFDMPYHMFSHARKYKIHFMTLIELAYSSRQKEHTIAFQRGDLFIQEKQAFKENVNFLVKAMRQHKTCKHRNTQLALCKYLLDENFDKKTFLDKLEKFPDKLVHSSTMDQALLNVKDLHNYFNKKTKLI